MNTEKLTTMKFSEFNRYLEEKPRKYATLARYRKTLSALEDKPNRKKLRLVEKLMKGQVEEGISTKRRREGTGTRVEQECVYKDTPGNRRLNRVGQTYTKVVYEGAEFEEAKRSKIRRRKRQSRETEDGKKKSNIWLDSVEQAKNELETPKFVIVYKELGEDPSEERVLGHKVYTRAVEIMNQKKAEAAAAAAAEAEANPATEATEASEATEAETPAPCDDDKMEVDVNPFDTPADIGLEPIEPAAPAVIQTVP